MSNKQNENDVVELRLTISINVVGAELDGMHNEEAATNQKVEADDDCKQEDNSCKDVNGAITDNNRSSFMSILRSAEDQLRRCIEQMQSVANAASYIDARDCVEGMMREFGENSQLANFLNLISEVQRVNTGAGTGDFTRQNLLDALNELHKEILHIIEVEEVAEKERQLDEQACKIIDDPAFRNSMLAMIKAALRQSC
jgi:hypothetical protein